MFEGFLFFLFFNGSGVKTVPPMWVFGLLRYL